MQKPWFLSIHIKTISLRFKENPLWGPFSVFDARKRRLRVNRMPKRGKNCVFKNIRIRVGGALILMEKIYCSSL